MAIPSKPDKQAAFFRDLHMRQRNIVFPDTVANEGRFYRNLVNGSLTPLQRVGAALVGLSGLAGVVMITLTFILPLPPSVVRPEVSTAQRAVNIGLGLFFGLLMLAVSARCLAAAVRPALKPASGRRIRRSRR